MGYSIMFCLYIRTYTVGLYLVGKLETLDILLRQLK